MASFWHNRLTIPPGGIIPIDNMNRITCPACGKPGAYCFDHKTCLRMQQEKGEMPARYSPARQSDQGDETPKPTVRKPRLASDAQARKNAPMARGLLDYFPNACAAVAECSRIANEQHNPGEPMHWARDKSDDHADSCVRHLVDRGLVDKDGIRHSTKAAWRALANLQIELEQAGEATS